MTEPKGAEAARLRQRKFELIRSFEVPPEALPGSLVQVRRKCGKATCHCAKGEGHPMWTLTFMDARRKRVERIPEEWVAEVKRRVEEGRALKDALDELLTANARLLVLKRKEATPRRRAPRRS